MSHSLSTADAGVNAPQYLWKDRSQLSAQQVELASRLREAFDVPMAILNLGTGELNHVTALWLHVAVDAWLPLIEEVARRGRPELIEVCEPLAVLAVPLPTDQDEPCDQVALATFLTQPASSSDAVTAAASAVQVDAEAVLRWSRTQPLWPPPSSNLGVPCSNERRPNCRTASSSTS